MSSRRVLNVQEIQTDNPEQFKEIMARAIAKEVNNAFSILAAISAEPGDVPEDFAAEHVNHETMTGAIGPVFHFRRKGVTIGVVSVFIEEHDDEDKCQYFRVDITKYTQEKDEP